MGEHSTPPDTIQPTEIEATRSDLLSYAEKAVPLVRSFRRNDVKPTENREFLEIFRDVEKRFSKDKNVRKKLSDLIEELLHSDKASAQQVNPEVPSPTPEVDRSSNTKNAQPRTDQATTSEQQRRLKINRIIEQAAEKIAQGGNKDEVMKEVQELFDAEGGEGLTNKIYENILQQALKLSTPAETVGSSQTATISEASPSATQQEDPEPQPPQETETNKEIDNLIENSAQKIVDKIHKWLKPSVFRALFKPFSKELTEKLGQWLDDAIDSFPEDEDVSDEVHNQIVQKTRELFLKTKDEKGWHEDDVRDVLDALNGHEIDPFDGNADFEPPVEDVPNPPTTEQTDTISKKGEMLFKGKKVEFYPPESIPKRQPDLVEQTLLQQSVISFFEKINTPLMVNTPVFLETSARAYWKYDKNPIEGNCLRIIEITYVPESGIVILGNERADGSISYSGVSAVNLETLDIQLNTKPGERAVETPITNEQLPSTNIPQNETVNVEQLGAPLQETEFSYTKGTTFEISHQEINNDQGKMIGEYGIDLVNPIAEKQRVVAADVYLFDMQSRQTLSVAFATLEAFNNRQALKLELGTPLFVLTPGTKQTIETNNFVLQAEVKNSNYSQESIGSFQIDVKVWQKPNQKANTQPNLRTPEERETILQQPDDIQIERDDSAASTQPPQPGPTPPVESPQPQPITEATQETNVDTNLTGLKIENGEVFYNGQDVEFIPAYPSREPEPEELEKFQNMLEEQGLTPESPSNDKYVFGMDWKYQGETKAHGQLYIQERIYFPEKGMLILKTEKFGSSGETVPKYIGISAVNLESLEVDY